MQRPIRVTLSPTALDADGIAQSQTPGGAGNLTLNGVLVSGGVATFSTPQHVTISSTLDDSGRTFIVSGTDREGVSITETIAGPNAGTVVGVKNFATVTQISVDAATTGAITAGVDGTCDSRWLQIDQWTNDPSLSFRISLGGGSMTYTVQSTLDSVFDSSFDESTAIAVNHGTVAAQTADITLDSYAVPVAAIRLQITAHTSGSASFDIVPTR